MTGENVTAFFALILIFGTGIVVAVSIPWFDHRTRTRALDVLRVYAERGEEPPASVTQALTWVSGWPRKIDPSDNRDRIGRPRTRGGFLAHVAANAVFAAGFWGFAWRSTYSSIDTSRPCGHFSRGSLETRPTPTTWRRRPFSPRGRTRDPFVARRACARGCAASPGGRVGVLAVLAALNARAIDAWMTADGERLWIVALATAATLWGIPFVMRPGFRTAARAVSRLLYP